MGAHGSVPYVIHVEPFEEHNVWIDPTGQQQPSLQQQPNLKVVSSGMLVGYDGGNLVGDERATLDGGKGLVFKPLSPSGAS